MEHFAIIDEDFDYYDYITELAAYHAKADELHAEEGED